MKSKSFLQSLVVYLNKKFVIRETIRSVDILSFSVSVEDVFCYLYLVFIFDFQALRLRDGNICFRILHMSRMFPTP